MRKKQKLLLHNTARKPLLRFRAVSDFRQQSPCPVVLSEIEPKADAILQGVIKDERVKNYK